MSGAMAPVTLTGVGSTAVYVPPPSSPVQALVMRFSGNYTGLQGVFEESFDTVNFTNQYGVRATYMGDGSNVTGTVSVPDSPTSAQPDNAYTVYPTSGCAIRFRVTAMGTGPVTVDGKATDFFPGVLSSGAQGASSLELQRLVLGLSALLDTNLAEAIPNQAPSSVI